MYELGHCTVDVGPADKIIGPFPDRDSCLDRLTHLSTESPGRAWLWARVGEMQREEGCEVLTPEQDAIKRKL